MATAPIDSPIGPDPAGTGRGPEILLGGHRAGRPVISVRTNWFMGEDHLDPAWTFGPEGERFEVEVTGDPTSRVTFRGLAARLDRRRPGAQSGVVATATHCVSAVPAVVAAEPGIRSYLDLPAYAGRAAPHLR